MNFLKKRGTKTKDDGTAPTPPTALSSPTNPFEFKFSSKKPTEHAVVNTKHEFYNWHMQEEEGNASAAADALGDQENVTELIETTARLSTANEQLVKTNNDLVQANANLVLLLNGRRTDEQQQQRRQRKSPPKNKNKKIKRESSFEQQQKETEEQEGTALWSAITSNDIFRFSILPKLDSTTAKFLSMASRESRLAIKCAKRELPTKFKFREASTKSTLDWMLDRCSKFNARGSTTSETYIASQIAISGNLELIKYLNEEKGFKFDERSIDEAAENGHLECVEYLHNETDAPWVDEEEEKYYCEECDEFHTDEDYSPEDDTACNLAAEHGHLEILKYAHAHQCPYDGFSMILSAVRCKTQNVEILKYVHEEMECEFDIDPEYAAEQAAAEGNIEALIYMREKRCDWNADACRAAAEHDHLDCLKWLHENGAPWDESCCNAAYEENNSECFEYAFKNGCPWDGKI